MPDAAPSSVCSIVLGAMVDIQRARSVYAMLDEALQRDDGIDVDAADVERIDTTGFQMLIVFAQTLAKQNRQVSLVNPSEAFMAQACLLGVTQHLPAIIQRPGRIQDGE